MPPREKATQGSPGKGWSSTGGHCSGDFSKVPGPFKGASKLAQGRLWFCRRWIWGWFEVLGLVLGCSGDLLSGLRMWWAWGYSGVLSGVTKSTERRSGVSELGSVPESTRR